MSKLSPAWQAALKRINRGQGYMPVAVRAAIDYLEGRSKRSLLKAEDIPFKEVEVRFKVYVPDTTRKFPNPWFSLSHPEDAKVWVLYEGGNKLDYYKHGRKNEGGGGARSREYYVGTVARFVPDLADGLRDPQQVKLIKAKLDELIAAGSVAFCDANQLDLSPEVAAEHISSESSRKRITREIIDRRGEQKFRNQLRKKYHNTCLITGCTDVVVLEAAHIDPVAEDGTDDPQNGLLLRADIHTLFDLDLIGINPKTMQVVVHHELSKQYGKYKGRKVCDGPSTMALEKRYRRFQQRLGESLYV